MHRISAYRVAAVAGGCGRQLGVVCRNAYGAADEICREREERRALCGYGVDAIDDDGSLLDITPQQWLLARLNMPSRVDFVGRTCGV